MTTAWSECCFAELRESKILPTTETQFTTPSKTFPAENTMEIVMNCLPDNFLPNGGGSLVYLIIV